MQPIPIQGASSQDNTTMYIVMMLLCCCCVSSSAAGGFWWTRIRPSGNMLQGHASGGLWRRARGIGDPRGRPKQTIAQCRAYATKRGYLGIGFRTPQHPSRPWRNTCFFYKRPLGARNWRGNPRDKAHKIGCANPGKTWPNC